MEDMIYLSFSQTFFFALKGFSERKRFDEVDVTWKKE